MTTETVSKSYARGTHFTKQDWTDLKVDFKMKGYMNDMEKATTLDI